MNMDFNAILDRREALGRLQPKCPACNHEQVQLVNDYKVPAQWKCRICKHPFELDLPTMLGGAGNEEHTNHRGNRHNR